MKAHFDHFTITMTQAQAESANHPGQCDGDVAVLLTMPAIKSQLRRISDADLRAELKEYGAWNDEELGDRKKNEARIIWIAAGHIVEGLK